MRHPDKRCYSKPKHDVFQVVVVPKPNQHISAAL